jgi:hypothetical protein
LEEDVIVSTWKEEFDPFSSDQHEGTLMEEELDVELDAFPLDVHVDSLAQGTKNLSFDQNAL